ncbi:MAG: NADP-dependent phosphogluconate dehydrogenase [bacterium]
MKNKNTVSVIGLGKMGSGFVLHLLEQGWKVTGYNRTREKALPFVKKGMVIAENYEDLAKKTKSKDKRVVILMLTAGEAVDEALFDKKNGLINFLTKGDIIIDAGNSFFEDAVRRGKLLEKLGFEFMDMGTSGGPSGARSGACLMVGGKVKTFKYVKELLVALAKEGAIKHFEGYGAGHFVKMVHNGIEYGMMQAIAEGYEILKKSKYKLNLKDVTEIYNNGSVIESRLIGWLGKAYKQEGEDLKEISSTVAHTGEGMWTINTAKKMGIEAKIIEESLNFRLKSEKNPRYAGKVVSALRNQFGGHEVKKK